MLVSAESVVVTTPSGPMGAKVIRPSMPGRYPGVVFYSEIFQLTGPVLRLASHLAGHGYAVLVPEVYHEFEPAGTVLGYDDAGKRRGNDLKTTKTIAAFDADAASAVRWLRERSYSNGRIGAMGICLGGHLAFRAALRQDVSAAACFYATDIHCATLGEGKSDDSLARAAEIKGELLMVFGRQDPHVPAEGRRKIYDALSEANVHFTWHEFNAAHAFLRDDDARHDPAATRLGFELVFELFHRRLADGDHLD